MDFVPFLSVTPGMNTSLDQSAVHIYMHAFIALAFRRWLGGEAKINAYCHELAVRGGRYLAELLGTKVMDETGELTLNMVSQSLPRLSSPLDTQMSMYELTVASCADECPSPAPC